MSIYAASVCRRNGGVLLSRQFVELGSERVHEMFGVYPKLLRAGSQHTTLEEDGSRFVYEPLDDLYVVLVSDVIKGNIVQDIKTLRLLTQLVKQLARPDGEAVDEKDVTNATFAIIDAFDEVVTMGYSESLSVAQVETFLRMESHEEKIQEIIERNKQLEAAEERKKKAKQLEMQRKASAASGPGAKWSSPDAFAASLAGAGPGAGAGFDTPLSSASQPSFEAPRAAPASSATSAKLGSKGLKLGKKGRSAGAGGAAMPLLSDPEPAARSAKASRSALQAAAAAEPAAPASKTTEISIAEQLTVDISREGTVRTSRVSGTLNLFAGDREHARLRIRTQTGGNPSAYKPHPKMDRKLFADSREIGLKNPEEELPPNVLLVKWTVDNVLVPITFSCWVSDSSDAGFMNVTLEYEIAAEFQGQLENVAVSVPLPTANAHPVDPGSNYEQFDDRIVWLIPRASQADPSGSFEFTAEADSEDDFYPIEVAFVTPEARGPSALPTLGQIDVEGVVSAVDGAELEFTKSSTASAASYVIR